MKRNNLIAFSLGLICAGLLWQYYLYPKYAKKVQDPQTMSDLLSADKAAMDEELANIPGELLFRSDQAPKPNLDNASISYVEDPQIEKEKITMIEAPAKHELIKTSAEYKKIRNILAEDLGQIDFSKDMIVLIKSNGKLNDGFFQIKNIENDGEKITISYSFNIIGAKDRAGKISAQKTTKSDLPIVLQQVL